MQANTEQASSSSSISDFKEGLAPIIRQFSWRLMLTDSNCDKSEESSPSDAQTDANDGEFSFASTRFDESLISADDVFKKGQMKPIFPFFDQRVLISGDYMASEVDLSLQSPVKRVLVAAEDYSDLPPVGPYCEWRGKAVEASPEMCEKSCSTGFSKLWRFRDLVHRSNSDGKDTFVFLKKEEKVERKERSPEKKISADEAKARAAGGKLKGKKSKTAPCSAHEMHYVRNKARSERNRMRSYLPYRPELFGFFTNVRGGLTKNVHPF